jgi:UDP:flavonoid glycosyltransferase YjiC (YdhE family)
MPKFLFTTLPTNDLGLLTRSLPIARELCTSGHEIIFSSPGKAPSKLISDAGFKNLIPKHPLYHIESKDLTPAGFIRRLASREVKEGYGGAFKFLKQLIRSVPIKFAPRTPEIWNMDHAAAMMGMMNTNFIRSQCVAYKNLILENNFDVIVDFWNPFVCMVARYLKKPLVTVIQADAHPANKGFIWWKEPKQMVPTALPSINKILLENGLQILSKSEELNLGDLTLIMGTPETDPLPDGSDGQYIGPILWEKEDGVLPEWIENLDNDHPIIWIYSGNPRYAKKRTVVDSEIIIDASIEAFARSKYQIILTTGHHSIPEKYLPLPTNIHFADYVPGLSLAKRCNLMIHHGGYGSCQTGLYAGTPAVIIPTFSERESNARRIASLGAGEFVLPLTKQSGKKQVDIAEFKSKVERVLEKESYKDKAKHYSKLLNNFGGAAYAAKLIEKFLKKKIIVTS